MAELSAGMWEVKGVQRAGYYSVSNNNTLPVNGTNDWVYATTGNFTEEHAAPGLTFAALGCALTVTADGVGDWLFMMSAQSLAPGIGYFLIGIDVDGDLPAPAATAFGKFNAGPIVGVGGVNYANADTIRRVTLSLGQVVKPRFALFDVAGVAFGADASTDQFTLSALRLGR